MAEYSHWLRFLNFPAVPSCLESYHAGAACQYAHVLTLVLITVFPNDATVYIGLSSSSHTLLEASDVEQMSNCTSLPGPLPQGIDLERQCQLGALGRYVYVFIEGRIGDNQLDIWELQMYGSM